MQSEPSRYDLELSDVNYIIERYQQRAYETDPVAGSYASFLNIIESSRQIISIGMDSIDYADVGIEEPREVEELEELIGEVACSDDTEYQYQTYNNPIGQDPITMDLGEKEKEIAKIDSQSDIEKCIDCGERPTSEFSFKPIFAMDGFRDLLNSLDSTMDSLMQQLDPYSFVNGLCPFLDGFANRTCKYDLKAMLGLLTMLMGRYSMAALEMTLNWSTLLGPLVKGVADIAGVFAEEIMRQVGYVFDCIKKYLFFAKDLITQTQQILAETGNLVDRVTTDSFKQVFKESDNWNSSTGRIIAGQKDNISGNHPAPTASNYFFGDYSFSENTMKGTSSLKTGPEFNAKSLNFSSKNYPSGSNFKKKGVLNSFAFEYGQEGESLERMFGLNKPAGNMKGAAKAYQAAGNTIGAANTEIIGRLLAVLNSAESYIKGLLSSLLLSIKSLDTMMSQGFSTTVKLGGLILFLSDMVNLLLSMADSKFSFSGGVCESLEKGDFKGFDALLKYLYNTNSIFDIEALENGQVRIDSGIYDIDSIKCGIVNEVTQEERSQNLNYKYSAEGNLNWLLDIYDNDFT